MTRRPERARTAFSSSLGVLLIPVLALWAAMNVVPAQESMPLLDLDTFPRTTVEIRSGEKKHEFTVWVAQTPEQQRQGLMFVRDLPGDRGMLFIAAKPRPFGMWMMNTYIPLDMVFIGDDGRIAKIAENTTPHSLEIVSSGGEVRAVLELKGGEAQRRGLRKGDRVSWKPPA